MSFNFVFFYIDTETNELSNKHKSLERKDIIFFIKSIKNIILNLELFTVQI